MNKIFIFFIFAAILATGGLFISQNKLTGSDPVNFDNFSIEVGGVTIDVEVMDAPDERARGLSKRASLPKDSGMLFLYDTSGYYSFWMRDMHFPIDIIWIDSGYKITEITKNISPDSYPEIFQPKKPVQYILEVNAGWSDTNEITIGELISF